MSGYKTGEIIVEYILINKDNNWVLMKSSNEFIIFEGKYTELEEFLIRSNLKNIFFCKLTNSQNADLISKYKVISRVRLNNRKTAILQFIGTNN